MQKKQDPEWSARPVDYQICGGECAGQTCAETHM